MISTMDADLRTRVGELEDRLQTGAAENARLEGELAIALERQTVTAGILNVIASSPTDVQPVFDVISESARRLLAGQKGARDTCRGRHASSGGVHGR